MDSQYDCIIIGYNEIPFEKYEAFLRTYSDEAEAYRDLKFSFIDLGDKKLDYIGLLNHILKKNAAGDQGLGDGGKFKSGEIPNLAAIYLSNFLEHRRYRVTYINLFQHEKDKLLDYLARDPVCIAITTTFYVLNQPVNEIVEFVREHNDKVKIIVGGPLIANHARNNSSDQFSIALKDIGADIYVIEGQGELALCNIIECLKSKGDLSRVPNIAYFKSGELNRTNVLPENNSLDESYIDWLRFREHDLGPTIQTRTARSCAFNCSFCNYPARAGKLTLASLDTLERELDSIRQLGNVKNVVFIDDTFNVPLPRFKEICRLMIRNNYQFNWFSYFRCSNSDEESFDLMAQSGCKGVFLGIESASPIILKNMNKAATVEKYFNGVRHLRQRNILTFASLIIGYPGETDATVDETIQFIRDARPDYYRAQLWYCEPGTPVDLQRAKYKINGEGFVWSHATMNSLEAMDHISKLFLKIKESLWLPQWSFDFWIIPYLTGRGISFEQFRDFMVIANKLLALDFTHLSERQKAALQQEHLLKLTRLAESLNKSIQ